MSKAVFKTRRKARALALQALYEVDAVGHQSEQVLGRLLEEAGLPEDKAEFVLSDFPQQKQAELDDMVLKAGNAVKSILGDGVSKTMAIFNA